MNVLHYGERLRMVRRITGTEQLALANALGISQPHYSRMEASPKSPGLETSRKLADVMKINPKVLEVDQLDLWHLASIFAGTMQQRWIQVRGIPDTWWGRIIIGVIIAGVLEDIVAGYRHPEGRPADAVDWFVFWTFFALYMIYSEKLIPRLRQFIRLRFRV